MEPVGFHNDLLCKVVRHKIHPMAGTTAPRIRDGQRWKPPAPEGPPPTGPQAALIATARASTPVGDARDSAEKAEDRRAMERADATGTPIDTLRLAACGPRLCDGARPLRTSALPAPLLLFARTNNKQLLLTALLIVRPLSRGPQLRIPRTT